VSTEMWGSPSRRKYICCRVWFRSRRMHNPDVLRRVKIILNFKHPQLLNRWESKLCSYDTRLETISGIRSWSIDTKSPDTLKIMILTSDTHIGL
jgi:hypothetical protein